MARDDWFRCTAWTKAERAAFDERIARSRTPWTKWQSFHIQAGLLAYHGTAKDALAEAVRLHERSLVEVKGLEDDWAAATLQRLGELAVKQGDLARAEQRLRESIARCPHAKRTIQDEQSAEAQLRAVRAQRKAAPKPKPAPKPRNRKERLPYPPVAIEPGFLYYLSGGDLWRRKQSKDRKHLGKPQLVAKLGIVMDDDYLYFIHDDGHVMRVRRAGR